MLYSGGQAQAQIQSLSYTAKPKIMQTPDNQGSPSQLYITPKDPKAEAAKNKDDDPLGLAARDLHENAKEEIDRVFALYKALSAQQNTKAAQKPLKTEPARNDSGHDNMQTIAPSGNIKQQASPGSFASILQRYQSKKANGTPTNSLKITDPKKFERATLPRKDRETEPPAPAHNQ